jgi:hypothetical protein
LNLVAEAAVCVVRPTGSLTGRVGDFTFGFTKPVPAVVGCSAGGFLADDVPDVKEAADFVDAVLVLAFGAVLFSGCPAFFSAALPASFTVAVAGLLIGFVAVGDLVGFAAVLPAVFTGATVLFADFVVLTAGLGCSLAPVLLLSLLFSLLIPFEVLPVPGTRLSPVIADLSVGPPTAIVVLTSSSSTVLSGFIGGAKALPFGDFGRGKSGI